MSVEAMRAVFKYSRSTKLERLLLITLADWADDDGYCFPSHRAIQQKSLLTDSALRRAIRRTIQAGELERIGQGHVTPGLKEFIGRTGFKPTNLYRITVVDRSSKQGPDGTESTTEDRVQGGGVRGVRLTEKRGSQRHAHIRNKPQDQTQDQTQDQKQGSAPPAAPETPDDNLGVITRLAHESIDRLGTAFGLGDLTADIKDHCVELDILWSPEVVRKALDSALWQRKHARPA